MTQPNGAIFLQETHSLAKDEKKRHDDFHDHIFFSHSKTNSCGVATGFYGTEKVDFMPGFYISKLKLIALCFSQFL